MSTGHKQERDRRREEREAEKAAARNVDPKFQVLAQTRKIIGAATMIMGITIEIAFPGAVGYLPGESTFDQAEQHLTLSTLSAYLSDLHRDAGHLTRFIDEPEKLKLADLVERVSKNASLIVSMARSLCETFHADFPSQVEKLATMGQGLTNFNLRLTSIDLNPSLIELASN